MRRWLRDRPEREIVIVAHGDILAYITDEIHADGPWGNTEFREYTFLHDGDTDAIMIPVVATGVVSVGENKPAISSLWPRHVGRTEIVY